MPDAIAWLDAIADLHGCTRSAVLREALRYLSARESERVARTHRYAIIALAARAERWDPVTDYLCGHPTEEIDAVCGGNAQRFWNLEVAAPIGGSS